MTDSAETIAAVLAGRHDGHLMEIVEAVRTRLQAGIVQTRWRVRCGDLEVTEEDITVGEVRLLEKMLGVSWFDIEPSSSSEHFGSLLEVLLHTRTGLDPKAAREQVNSIPMGDLLSHLSEYELTPAPKD